MLRFDSPKGTAGSSRHLAQKDFFFSCLKMLSISQRWLVLILFAAFGSERRGSARAAEDSSACSLPLSREAAVILSARLHGEQLDGSMHAACALRVEASRFGVMLHMDMLQRDGLRHCTACDAAFATQRDMDAHLVHAHADQVHTDGHCLSSQCDVLGCPSLPGVAACTPQSMATLKRRCLHLVHQCFDGDSPVAHAAFDAAAAALCEPLRCVDGQRVIATPPPPPSSSSFWAFLFHWLKLVFVGGFVLAFYAFFYCWRREANIKDDLTRLAVQRRHLQAKLFEREKLKGY